MSTFEKWIVYFFSFLFFPIGWITWIVSLFNQSQQVKRVGRIALYVACTSFCLQLIIGVLNFVLYTNLSLSTN